MASVWRRVGGIAGLWALCLALSLGCATQKDYLKPPKIQEELRAPPSNEARFSRPVEYHKEVLNEDMLAKKASKLPLGALKGSKGGVSPGGISN